MLKVKTRVPTEHEGLGGINSTQYTTQEGFFDFLHCTEHSEGSLCKLTEVSREGETVPLCFVNSTTDEFGPRDSQTHLVSGDDWTPLRAVFDINNNYKKIKIIPSKVCKSLIVLKCHLKRHGW